MYSQCPEYLGEITFAIPWINGNEGSTDFFHTCATGSVGVPDNYYGIQLPYSGLGYAGLTARTIINFREYATIYLTQPLIAGNSYMVTFYVSVGDEYCRTSAIGALFTIDPPVYNNDQILDYDPQVEEYGYLIGDFESWTEISRCFIAEGGEQYITLGNFRHGSELIPDVGCGINGEISYYYIDEISVVTMPLSEESFVLDPVVACDSFEIFPGNAQNYLWDDGTTNPTMTVSESGTYFVTLSDECAFSYGEIEITIIPGSPVALPNDTLLCSGEAIEISLNPDAGDYEWEDGNTGPDYTISSTGLYAVTLTNNCGMTADTINVIFLDVPEPFSLGADTLICDGDAYSISFDPGLGDFTWQDQSSSSSYTISNDGTYALTISNICGQASDLINVDFVPALDFSIGPAQYAMCEGDIIEIELDPDIGYFLWSDGSTSHTFTVTEEGVVSVTVTNACESASDEMLVSILHPPVFDLGPDVTICSGLLPYTLNLAGVQYAQEWEWTGGSSASVYEVTAPGTYSVTVSNGCFAQTDQVTISVADINPVVMLPPDQSLCPGQTLVLDVGGIQGNYQWQDLSTADTFLVSESGVYTLQVTNICGIDTDSIVIDYLLPLPDPDLGVDFSLCPGESALLYANVHGVNYTWSDSSHADSLLINSPGMYWLEITDQCSIASDSVVVSQNTNPPNINLPASLNLCEGDSVTIHAGINGVEYAWSNGSQQSSITVSQPGVYQLTVTNTCGMDIDTVDVIDSGPVPFVELGSDTSLCPGDAFVLTPASLNIDTWQWNDNSTASTLTVNSPGTIIVNVSNQCGFVSDTLVVEGLNDVPQLDLGNDITLCPGESETLSILIPDVNIAWSDNTTVTNYDITEAGQVYATISNACGLSSDTVEVTFLDPIPDLHLGNDQSLCPGESFTLAPAIPGVEYLWQDGSTNPTYQVTSPGTIICIITNACGSSSDTLEIIFDPNGPHVDLGPDVLGCAGDTVVLSAGVSGVTYQWQDGSMHSTLAVMSSGTYSLHVSNACGMDSDTVIVDLHGTSPTPTLGPDTILCEGEVLQLTSTADSETAIEWQDGSANPQFVVSVPGAYILTESNHCGIISDTVIIDFESPPPAIDLGEDLVICDGDTVILNAPQTDALITWHNGSHEEQFLAFNAQTYRLALTNICGITSDEIEISIDNNEPQISLEDLEICDGESVMLDATQPFTAEYEWSTGSTSPAIMVSSPDLYTVTVLTQCYSSEDHAEVSYSDECSPHIYIPNIFSPNNDNINDVWEVLIDPGLHVSNLQCQIFDRWGDLLFEANNPPALWDGQFHGDHVMPGVYVFVLRFDYLLNGLQKSFLQSGDITLIR